MFAAPGKAGMRQQHDRRWRPVGTGEAQVIGVQAGVGAA